MRARTLDVQWTDELTRELADVFAWLRMEPEPKLGSAPEMMSLAIRAESRLCAEFQRRIAAALERSTPDALDCDILELFDGLRNTHARMQERLAIGGES